MSNTIKNENGQSWDGEKFSTDGKPLKTMDQLNTEVAKIASTGYKGKVAVVPEGCIKSENPNLEFDI